MPDPRKGRCYVCGCTEKDACPGGCGWTDGDMTLCTTCALFVKSAESYIDQARRSSPASFKRIFELAISGGRP